MGVPHQPPRENRVMQASTFAIFFLTLGCLLMSSYTDAADSAEEGEDGDDGQEQLTPVSASMSSTHTKYKAELRINGKDDGKDEDRKNPDMCASNQDPVPWIALDFGDEMQVSVGKVLIVNRINCSTTGQRTWRSD